MLTMLCNLESRTVPLQVWWRGLATTFTTDKGAAEREGYSLAAIFAFRGGGKTLLTSRRRTFTRNVEVLLVFLKQFSIQVAMYGYLNYCKATLTGTDGSQIHHRGPGFICPCPPVKSQAINAEICPEYPYSKILANIAAHKSCSSEVAFLNDWSAGVPWASPRRSSPPSVPLPNHDRSSLLYYMGVSAWGGGGHAPPPIFTVGQKSAFVIRA